MPDRPITNDHLSGLPGLRLRARQAILDSQPTTVLEALSLPDVGRKTTKHLLALGLVTDPHGVQNRAIIDFERQLRRAH